MRRSTSLWQHARAEEENADGPPISRSTVELASMCSHRHPSKSHAAPQQADTLQHVWRVEAEGGRASDERSPESAQGGKREVCAHMRLQMRYVTADALWITWDASINLQPLSKRR